MSTKLVSRIESNAGELIQAADRISTGARGLVRAVTVGDTIVAIKTALDEAPPNTVRREAEHNEIANSVGVGPTFYYYDEDLEAMFRQYVTGFPFDDWLRYTTNCGRPTRCTLRNIYDQCRRLDKRRLHRPELSRPHDDIIIGDEPMIIDFERCTFQRHPTNVLHFTECLLRKRYASMLNVTERTAKKRAIREDCRDYKEGGGDAVYNRLSTTVLDWVTG